MIDTVTIVAEILNGYALNPRGLHGVVHWARVMENGWRLAEITGADPDIVTLFALFHDSRRLNDGSDWGHGLRGANLAKRLHGSYFELDDTRFDLLYRACERHTEGTTDLDITVSTCWDSDRLDLGRVGIEPDLKYLCTDAARFHAILRWANKRATSDYEPAIVIAWNVPMMLSE